MTVIGHSDGQWKRVQVGLESFLFAFHMLERSRAEEETVLQGFMGIFILLPVQESKCWRKKIGMLSKYFKQVNEYVSTATVHEYK